MKKIFISFIVLFLFGCEDKNVYINKYDKNLKHIECLELQTSPFDIQTKSILKKLYNFSQNCPYTLKVDKKTNITCNSNQNVDKKALSNFPSGYLRLDIYKNSKIIYSYYKDLDEIEDKDIKKAFLHVKKDLL